MKNQNADSPLWNSDRNFFMRRMPFEALSEGSGSRNASGSSARRYSFNISERRAVPPAYRRLYQSSDRQNPRRGSCGGGFMFCFFVGLQSFPLQTPHKDLLARRGGNGARLGERVRE